MNDEAPTKRDETLERVRIGCTSGVNVYYTYVASGDRFLRRARPSRGDVFPPRRLPLSNETPAI